MFLTKFLSFFLSFFLSSSILSFFLSCCSIISCILFREFSLSLYLPLSPSFSLILSSLSRSLFPFPSLFYFPSFCLSLLPSLFFSLSLSLPVSHFLSSLSASFILFSFSPSFSLFLPLSLPLPLSRSLLLSLSLSPLSPSLPSPFHYLKKDWGDVGVDYVEGVNVIIWSAAVKKRDVFWPRK